MPFDFKEWAKSWDKAMADITTVVNTRISKLEGGYHLILDRLGSLSEDKLDDEELAKLCREMLNLPQED